MRGGSNKGWTTVVALRALSNAHFERLVWRAFEDRLRNGEFDVVHRVIPVSPTIPSVLAERCARIGAPFVVGPLNGGLTWPSGFGGARRREREWLSYLRGAYKALPGCGSMRRHASAIVAGSRHTLSEMPASAMERCVYLPENAIDPALFPAPAREPGAGPIRVAFVGRLVAYKGADMLVEAAAPQVRAGKLRLEIIGEGPERGRIEAMIERLGVRDGVTMAGWVEHAKLHERLGRADVFAFPSIREFGGAVVLEAMALGCVPIVVDYGGPAEMVTASTGYVVPKGAREQIVGSFASVFETLVAHPDGISAMGAMARRRAMSTFTWEAKARQTLEIYRWVVGERKSKPDFGMPLADVGVDEGRSAA
jgi:glycosyltransferase involved in cell wall biosynthesis